MILHQALNYVFALILCFIEITICDSVFSNEPTDCKLLGIIVSHHGQERSRYPLQSQINYSTVNSKDESIKKPMSHWDVLEGIHYLQQKQTHRRTSPARDQNLRAFFLSKYIDLSDEFTKCQMFLS